MVKEAQNKVMEIIQQAVQCVGQLAVLKGSKLCVLENSSKVSSTQVMHSVSAGRPVKERQGLQIIAALHRITK